MEAVIIILLIVIPLLCLWCGMLLHYRVTGKARVWFQAVAGLVAAFMFYLSRHTVNAPGLSGQAAAYLFVFFLGSSFRGTISGRTETMSERNLPFCAR